MKPEVERVHQLLTDTVTLLCKNGLQYRDELRVEGVIGITIDKNEVFLVHVNEAIGAEGLQKDLPRPVGDGSINATTLSELPGIVARANSSRGMLPRAPLRSFGNTRRAFGNRMRRGSGLLNRRQVTSSRGRGVSNVEPRQSVLAPAQAPTQTSPNGSNVDFNESNADAIVKLEPTSPMKEQVSGAQESSDQNTFGNLSLDDMRSSDLTFFDPINESVDNQALEPSAKRLHLDSESASSSYLPPALDSASQSGVSSSQPAESSTDITSPVSSYGMSGSINSAWSTHTPSLEPYAMTSPVKQEPPTYDISGLHPTPPAMGSGAAEVQQAWTSQPGTPKTPQRHIAGPSQRRSSETNWPRKSSTIHNCPACSIDFTNRKDLDQHLKVAHGVKRKHHCVFCNKVFTDYSNLRRHMRKHSGKEQFQCQYCDKKFVDKDHYDGHVNMHEGVKPYSCAKCEKCFAYLNAFRAHRKKCNMGIVLQCSGSLM